MLDLSNIKYNPTLNRGVRNVKPTWIVIHATGGGTFVGTQSWFHDPKSEVSAHYVVDKTGEMVCMVYPEDKAWHTLNFNNESIGIEFVDGEVGSGKNCTSDPSWFTTQQLQAGTDLVAALCQKYNIPVTQVIGHNNQKLRKLGNTHSDPGNFFPWIKFIALVKEKMSKTINE